MSNTLSARKIAVLLLALRPDAARALMHELTSEERAAIGVEVGHLSGERATRHEMENVLQEFQGSWMALGQSEPLRISMGTSRLTFHDLARCDDRGMRALVSEVGEGRFALAFKIPAPGVAERVFAVLSKSSRRALREEIEALGPVSVQEVMAARQEIEASAERLEHERILEIGPLEVA